MTQTGNWGAGKNQRKWKNMERKIEASLQGEAYLTLPSKPQARRVRGRQTLRLVD